MGYRLITAPASAPVTLAEAKAQLRVDFADEDTLISGLIDAAVSYLDGRTGILGRCLVTQTWELTLDAFPSDEIELPLGPVQSITSIKYFDTAGALQTLSSANYIWDDSSLSDWIIPQADWPDTLETANAVTVRYVAGTDAASVPKALKQAILLLVAHWFENRQPVAVGASVAEMPMAVQALIALFRRLSV